VWKIFNLGVVASLVFAFAQSPFHHTHDGDPGHQHARGFSHAHWIHNHHEPEGLGLDGVDHDSDSRLQDWLAGDGSALVKFVPDLPLSVVPPLQVVQESLLPKITPQNHDPPWRLCLHPRAPPA
jgi:hypothetical protein